MRSMNSAAAVGGRSQGRAWIFRQAGAAALGLGLLTAVGCGGGASSSSGGGESGEHASAGGETSYAGPIRSTDVALGERKYNSRCAGCHAGGPSLQGIAWPVARVRQQIREGSGNMGAVPVSALSDDDMEAVLAYLVTIQACVDEGASAPAEGVSEPATEATP